MISNKNLPQGRHIAGKKISGHGMQEFAKGKGDYIFCPKGEAVYYKKSWHHIAKFFLNPPDSKRDKSRPFHGVSNPMERHDTDMAATPRQERRVLKGRDKDVVFELCPAHEMEKNKQYEGEVVVRDVPDMFRQDLAGLIERMGEHAMRRDVLDRVFAMRWAKNQLTVTTSENQLAQKIGRKIKETFKKHIVEHIVRPKGGDSDFVSVQIAFVPSLIKVKRGRKEYKQGKTVIASSPRVSR